MIQAVGFIYEGEDLEVSYRKAKIHFEKELGAKNLNFNPFWMHSQECKNRFYCDMNFYMGEQDGSSYSVMVGIVKDGNLLRTEVTGTSRDTIEQILESIEKDIGKTNGTIKRVSDCSATL